ncbi:MAG TPA: Hsp20/alpha crystallin family protein [Vicinamibacterales bacterium]|nr:Hsp20/alpha crystallin family protein [Vicinamibacterales bacterium]HOG28801.1 Hsp20/alpha crystallin family protein [Vicinamibacterales bacterium]HOQ59229.1 Hsp20/alpha crystallin family protein [Vicinamibacterales bacterium]HPW20530.1 Hsp20/alpha crystallin family protein [Vicinamibacterales bacterium]
MTLVRWDPFRELSAMQERMNRLFGEAYRPGEDDVMRRGAWVPPVDIYDAGNHELVIKAELPDMTKDDIEIVVANNSLTLRGEKKMDSSIKEESCHRIERTYGAFSRSFSLPPTVDASKVSADYKNGVLTIKLPVREDAKPKQIQVRVQD